MLRRLSIVVLGVALLWTWSRTSTRHMAMVIMFGLLSSTALNMIVVPILYERFGRPVTSQAV